MKRKLGIPCIVLGAALLLGALLLSRANQMADLFAWESAVAVMPELVGQIQSNAGSDASKPDKTPDPDPQKPSDLLTEEEKKMPEAEIDGKLCSRHHETLGLPLAERFLLRLTNEARIISYVTNLTEHHMRPNAIAAFGSSVKATNKMFDSVSAAKDLFYFAKSDHFGRICTKESPFLEDFLLERLHIYEDIMREPYVMGRDLLGAGLTPGPHFSQLLAHAHKLRLAGVKKEEALKQTLAYAKELQKSKKRK